MLDSSGPATQACLCGQLSQCDYLVLNAGCCLGSSNRLWYPVSVDKEISSPAVDSLWTSQLLHCEGPIYTTVSGDTCAALAATNNVDINKLKSMNPQLVCSPLVPGQKICVGKGAAQLFLSVLHHNSCVHHMHFRLQSGAQQHPSSDWHVSLLGLSCE